MDSGTVSVCDQADLGVYLITLESVQNTASGLFQTLGPVNVVLIIKEHSLQLPGVEIVETSARSYDQSDIIPAVLGRVGKITAEKWKVTDSNGQVTYPLREKG